MPEDRRPLRVLQFIGDTDVTDAHVAAVALHRELGARGVQVRTLALGPGARGGLDTDVPVVAPARRSFAARGAVLHESRWADVVVLHAPRAMTVATLPGVHPSGAPRVLAVWDSPDSRTPPVWSAERRIARTAAWIVVPSVEVQMQLAERYGPAARIRVVPGDLTEQGRPRLDAGGWVEALGDRCS